MIILIQTLSLFFFYFKLLLVSAPICRGDSHRAPHRVLRRQCLAGHDDNETSNRSSRGHCPEGPCRRLRPRVMQGPGSAAAILEHARGRGHPSAPRRPEPRPDRPREAGRRTRSGAGLRPAVRQARPDGLRPSTSEFAIGPAWTAPPVAVSGPVEPPPDEGPAA